MRVGRSWSWSWSQCACCWLLRARSASRSASGRDQQTLKRACTSWCASACCWWCEPVSLVLMPGITVREAQRDNNSAQSETDRQTERQASKCDERLDRAPSRKRQRHKQSTQRLHARARSFIGSLFLSLGGAHLQHERERERDRRALGDTHAHTRLDTTGSTHTHTHVAMNAWDGRCRQCRRLMSTCCCHLVHDYQNGLKHSSSNSNYDTYVHAAALDVPSSRVYKRKRRRRTCTSCSLTLSLCVCVCRSISTAAPCRLNTASGISLRRSRRAIQCARTCSCRSKLLATSIRMTRHTSRGLTASPASTQAAAVERVPACARRLAYVRLHRRRLAHPARPRCRRHRVALRDHRSQLRLDIDTRRPCRCATPIQQQIRCLRAGRTRQRFVSTKQRASSERRAAVEQGVRRWKKIHGTTPRWARSALHIPRRMKTTTSQ